MASGAGAKAKKSLLATDDGPPPLKGTTMAKFVQLSKRSHSAQAKWFLNSFWTENSVNLSENLDACEHIFTACKLLEKLDPNGAKGNEIDQLTSHRFLETIDSAMTYTKFKKTWKAMDIDFNGNLSLCEYLLNKFDIADEASIGLLVNVTVKSSAALREAEAKLLEVQQAHEEQLKAQEEAERAKEVAEAQRADALKAKQEADAMKAEALRIQGEIQAFKERFNAISAKFQAKIDDESLGIVKRNKAKAELGAHLNGARARKKNKPELDPQSLHVMEIDQGAAVRKQKKFAKKQKKALKLQEEALAAQHAAVEKQQEMVKLVAQRMEEAREEVERIAASGSQAGVAWWLGRELQDMQKYMSKKEFARLQKKVNKKQSELEGK